MSFRKHATAAALLIFVASPVFSAEQEAIDGCIDQLRVVGGPDGQSGEVLSSEFSEAATLVMLRDRGGTIWRCVAYSDGTVGELSIESAADDGGGAMAGATDRVRVSFDAGTTGTELSDTLAPGGSRQYVIGASAEQFLYTRVAADGPTLDYQIFNPDSSFLLERTGGDLEYRGQLWQSGDHVIEVINRTGSEQSYNLIIGIE
ncbi:hypothetical protein [Marivita geojedonensis]|uniref:Uncharacterized protein n=1 Tax=Marivita geojedonensis TaxID=1123756 RepID=A0A1X4N9H4_9RHOB|nr:hypothetical protein [Marivita geojedonensis]OSQ42894.1 hypothetical protein MGEO_20180 [Marivita geojedonensis]PRY71850.1 hypothetical protein CLV76_13913 [Marivita geojedonensis]